MRVVCVGTLGSDLPAVALGRTANFPTSQFGVVIGSEYTVYAMRLIGSGVLEYLVDPDGDNRTHWSPADLFTVSDPSVPDWWLFRYEGNYEGILALWGYPEMVLSDTHHDDLIEREPDACAVFSRRRAEADSGR